MKISVFILSKTVVVVNMYPNIGHAARFIEKLPRILHLNIEPQFYFFLQLVSLLLQNYIVSEGSFALPRVVIWPKS